MDHAHPHEHAHPHPHAHPHEHVHRAEQAPAENDNLLLDIGGDTGALIISAGADRDQAEVEISPAGREQPRSHNIVRQRALPDRVVYAAVFPALPAGDYDVWRDKVTRAGTVPVPGGQVASFQLD